MTLKGIKLTDEHRRKISESNKVAMKGKKNHLGHKHSERSKEKMRIAMIGRYKGDKSSAWKGGITSAANNRIGSSRWGMIRKQVYKRDNYTCQICGIQYKDKNGNPLHAHHIVPYRINRDDSLDNLITLCASCHMKEEHKYYNSNDGKTMRKAE